MADVKMISVTARALSWWMRFLRHVAFWALLVAVEWAAHVAFGGSWVVDVMVLMMAIIGFVATFVVLSGTSVSMTKDEIAKWVNAGQPDDIKAWRLMRRARLDGKPLVDEFEKLKVEGDEIDRFVDEMDASIQKGARRSDHRFRPQ